MLSKIERGRILGREEGKESGGRSMIPREKSQEIAFVPVNISSSLECFGI